VVLKENFFAIGEQKFEGEADHGAVFPRVAAVLTHGGAGTTHAAVRSGRPTVILPFLVDQPVSCNNKNKKTKKNQTTKTPITGNRKD
jgi:hypothetical protein